MNHIILIGHGKLAHEMKNSTEMIFGELSNFTTLDFLKEDGLDSLQNKIDEVIKKNSLSTLILTDLFCGTPYNASCAVAMKHKNRKIEVISGMSLPLTLEIASMNPSEEVEVIASHIIDISSKTVKSFLLQNIEDEEEL